MPRSRLSILLLGSLPGDEQLLQQDHEGEEQNAQHRDGHDRSKETGFVQLEVEEAELVADAGGIGGVGIKAKDAGQTESCESGAHRVPAAAGHPLAHDGADEGQRRGDFERGEEERYGRWKAQLEEDLRAAGVEEPHQLVDARIDRLEPHGHVHQRGEESDEDSDADHSRRVRVGAEQRDAIEEDDEQWNVYDDRNGLNENG